MNSIKYVHTFSREIHLTAQRNRIPLCLQLYFLISYEQLIRLYIVLILSHIQHADCSTFVVELPASSQDGFLGSLLGLRSSTRACSTGFTSGRPNPTRLDYRLYKILSKLIKTDFDLHPYSIFKLKHNF